jgi:hypothetical protein
MVGEFEMVLLGESRQETPELSYPRGISVGKLNGSMFPPYNPAYISPQTWFGDLWPHCIGAVPTEPPVTSNIV